jgi:UTP--glucose-1-phosphate uridylyltransferase
MGSDRGERYLLVVAAGGMATRALVLTGYGAKPKCLVNAGCDGATVLDEIVREALGAGLEEGVFIVASETDRAALERFFYPLRQDPLLAEHLRRAGRTKELAALGARPPLRPRVLVQVEPRGFGDAVAMAYPFLSPREGRSYTGAVVALGDDLVHAPVSCMEQLVSAHRQVGGMIVAVQPVARDAARRYGVVTVHPTPLALDGTFLGRRAYKALRVEEKPPDPEPNLLDGVETYLAIVGRYVLGTEDVAFLAGEDSSVARELDFTSLLRRNAAAGTLTAVEPRGVWVSVGTPQEAQRAFLRYALVPQSGEPTPSQAELIAYARDLLGDDE